MADGVLPSGEAALCVGSGGSSPRPADRHLDREGDERAQHAHPQVGLEVSARTDQRKGAGKCLLVLPSCFGINSIEQL